MMMLGKFICLLLTASALCAYDEREAILQAKYSVISHCSTAQIESWSCALCKTSPRLAQISVVENTATKIRGFVGYDASSNTIVVSWRGTDNNLNWIEDMDFKLIDYQGSARCTNCKIHEGFFNAYYSVSAKTHDKVKEIADKYPTAKIVITGHSLGGALAVVGSTRPFIQLSSSARSTRRGSLRSTCTAVREWATEILPLT